VIDERAGVRSSLFHPPACGVVLCRESDDLSTPLDRCLFRRYDWLVVRPPRIEHAGGVFPVVARGDECAVVVGMIEVGSGEALVA